MKFLFNGIVASAILANVVAKGIQFDVTFSDETKSFIETKTTVQNDNEPLGRVQLYISRNNDKDPIHACDDTQETNQVFGVDYFKKMDGKVSIDESVLGYPVASLNEIDFSSQKFYLQAKFVRYEQYNREDGSKPVLPVSCVSAAGGDGAYGDSPGSLFSKTVDFQIPREVHAESSSFRRLTNTPTIVLDQIVPSAESVAPKCGGNGQENTEYIRTVRVKSERLSKFWGRDIVLEACVLLPYGFDDPKHADAKYPLVVAHGHYSNEWNAGGRFSETPPKPATGYKYVDDLYAYYLYQNWTMPDEGPFQGARMLVITVNHPVPFFDDSYAVNSASMGPYGDAIVYDLIPEVERQYRGIGEGWARSVFGGSTGGWESVASQVFYPDEFNGAYASCPDPISFESFAQVNIYEYSNAYFYPAQFKKTPIPAVRGQYDGQMYPIAYGKSSPYGRVSATMQEANWRELVLGEKSRSCGQWDAWTAVFSPLGEDGYPKPLYNKKTGEIDPEVAQYWKENYDLLQIMKANWKTLGPKLVKKLHIFVGASDAFYLNNAVMDVQDFLESTSEPYYDGEVLIGQHHGRGFSHCFSGNVVGVDGELLPNSITRQILTQRFLPRMANHFAATAPEGADVTSWRY